MEFEEIEWKVIEWAKERGIYENYSAQAQIAKLIEELGELANALNREDSPEVMDALGDMLVVMTNICRGTLKLPLTICYEEAYNQIKDRKGKMVNGTFVKD
jgi:NTP pyrophosphatase (non-canonical NTP hydrolase)